MGKDKAKLIPHSLHLSPHSHLFTSILPDHLPQRKRSFHLDHRLIALLLLHLLLASHHLRNIGTGSTLRHHASATVFTISNLFYSGTKRHHHVCLLETDTLNWQYFSLPAWKDPREHGLRHSSYRFFKGKHKDI